MTKYCDILAENVPTSLNIFGASAEFALIEAESSDGNKKLKKFSIVGYTGGTMRLEGWYYPVVVSLEGMKIPRQNIPALMGHERKTIVGHTDSIEKSAQRLKLAGVFSGHSDVDQTPSSIAAREIVRLAANGFEWQASIGASPDKVQFVPEGESVKVNGRNFDGPLYAVLESTLAEISFVAIGADMNTSANVAATAAINKGIAMNEFDKWLTAKGIEADKLTEQLKATLKIAFDAEIKAAENAKIEGERKKKEDGEKKLDGHVTFQEKFAAIEAENSRIEHIREKAALAAQAHVGNQAKVAEIRDLAESAIADQKIDARAFDLALIRIDRAIAPTVFATKEPMMNDEVIEAAICVTQKLKDVESLYSDQVLQAAHTRFRRGIGLKEMLQIAAERNNGYRGSIRDEVPLCRAAFRTIDASYGGDRFVAAAGPSTIDVTGILSNVGNKFLSSGFLYTEQSWRDVARRRPANDFKQMTTYRLTGANKFLKVPPGGEIKHGTLSELSYTNQVDTYGIMLGIDRRDIRNDDLGALTGRADELGRGAGDALNEVFWTTWLDDADFFNTDKSKNNYDDGAVDSALTLAGLDNADTIFGLQTKPDNTPMGIMPTILLVPRALRATALNLMNGSITAAAQSTATVTTKNIWEGMFKVVSSVYLQSSAIAGSSSTAWYLLADPMNVAAIEVAFLDGVESPIVETGEFDFERLGLTIRGFMDFGISKQEYRAAVKLKGAA